MIHLQGITKSYQLGDVPLPILKGVSLDIEAGDFVAIMGASGSGKSTLLNIIGCLDTFDDGQYRLQGIDVGSAGDDELAAVRNVHIGFVFQLFNLIPRINAVRNVELPMVYAGVPERQRRAQALEALEMVGLAERSDHTPSQLSGGQQQRVAIARALVNRPQLIIADEPTGSLDTRSGEEVMQLFEKLHEAGKTIVMVTHEEEIAAYAGRTVRMRDGLIEQDIVRSRGRAA